MISYLIRIKGERADQSNCLFLLCFSYQHEVRPFTLPAVCELVEEGVQAIFGPSDHVLGMHIDSICDALDIPHLKTGPDLDLEEATANENAPVQDDHVNALNAPADYFPLLSAAPATDDNDIAPRNQQQQQFRPLPPRFLHARPTRHSRRFAINLYPAQHLINAALLDVVQYLNWTRVAIVFEENDGTRRSLLISAHFLPILLMRSGIHFRV